ncbi:hypothetical protein [Bacillus cereus]|uniref:hypothetical protein n=1 Tax=Bacillus cereus TaxID=1396 RepID=UPI00397FC581
MMGISNYEALTKSNFNEVLKSFLPKIKKSLRNTPFQEREDLEQEIKLKIYEKMDMLDDFSPPSFFEFIEKD